MNPETNAVWTATTLMAAMARRPSKQGKCRGLTGSSRRCRRRRTPRFPVPSGTPSSSAVGEATSIASGATSSAWVVGASWITALRWSAPRRRLASSVRSTWEARASRARKAVRSQVMPSTRRSAPWLSLRRSIGLVRIEPIASTSPVIVETRNPDSSSMTASSWPAIRVATAGVPQAAASVSVMPHPSCDDVEPTTQARR